MRANPLAPNKFDHLLERPEPEICGAFLATNKRYAGTYRLPSSVMQLLGRSILDISQDDVRRFPAACLHDGKGVEAGDEHVLGGADTHVAAGQFCGSSGGNASAAGWPPGRVQSALEKAGIMFISADKDGGVGVRLSKPRA